MTQKTQEALRSSQIVHPSLELNAEPVARLVALFREKSETLRFPDVDAEVLSKIVTEVEERREVVEAAQLALGEARESLVLLEQELLEKAKRGHAYAAVFAAGDEELSAALSEIKLSAGQRPVRKRRPVVKKAEAKTAPSDAEDPIQQELSAEIAAE